jgi:hypothetical protein
MIWALTPAPRVLNLVILHKKMFFFLVFFFIFHFLLLLLLGWIFHHLFFSFFLYFRFFLICSRKCVASSRVVCVWCNVVCCGARSNQGRFLNENGTIVIPLRVIKHTHTHTWIFFSLSHFL